MKQVYKIKKAFITPFSLAVALLAVLLALSLWSGPSWERIIVAILLAATLVIAIEARSRYLSVSEDGLSIKKFFRVKNFSWAEITHLGIVVLRNKVFFLLTTTKGFYMFSNLLQDHPLLIRYLTEKLGAEKVEVEVNNYLEKPIERTSLIVLTWVAVIIVISIILTKLIV